MCSVFYVEFNNENAFTDQPSPSFSARLEPVRQMSYQILRRTVAVVAAAVAAVAAAAAV